jgi:hypothetical protein
MRPVHCFQKLYHLINYRYNTRLADPRISPVYLIMAPDNRADRSAATGTPRSHALDPGETRGETAWITGRRSTVASAENGMIRLFLLATETKWRRISPHSIRPTDWSPTR